MPTYTVMSLEYGPGFSEQLIRRLKRWGIGAAADGGAVAVSITENSEQSFVSALSELILNDIKPLELSRLAFLLPISARDRSLILPCAMSIADDTELIDYVKTKLEALLGETRLIVAEGVLRFRMPLLEESWAAAIDRAGEELLIDREYTELLELLGLISETSGESRGEVDLILHSDGSCIITDERGQRIECATAEESGLLPLIMGIAPDTIAVYDLTGGKGIRIMQSISAVFGERACFFISIGSDDSKH